MDQYKDEIRDSGFLQGGKEQYVNTSAWCVSAMDDGKPVGFILIMPYRETDCLWISDAFVLPEYRRKGIHSLMFARVARQAEIEGVSAVGSGVHVTNKASIAAMESQGREVTGFFYRYEIKKKEST